MILPMDILLNEMSACGLLIEKGSPRQLLSAPLNPRHACNQKSQSRSIHESDETQCGALRLNQKELQTLDMGRRKKYDTALQKL